MKEYCSNFEHLSTPVSFDCHNSLVTCPCDTHINMVNRTADHTYTMIAAFKNHNWCSVLWSGMSRFLRAIMVCFHSSGSVRLLLWVKRRQWLCRRYFWLKHAKVNTISVYVNINISDKENSIQVANIFKHACQIGFRTTLNPAVVIYMFTKQIYRISHFISITHTILPRAPVTYVDQSCWKSG